MCGVPDLMLQIYQLISRLFVTFIDDCTRVNWVYINKQKSEATSLFLHFFSMVKTRFGVSIKIVMYDNVKDYFVHEFNSFCQKGYYS
jgi:hypothetical protein